LKALILSGGKGTRLRPITHTSAKQLVPVANKPILFFAIEAIREAGITDIGIIVGDTAREIEAAVGDGADLGVNATYIHQAAPLGLAHAVKIAQDFIGADSFVMFLGDNFIKDGISPLVREFEEERPNSQILLARVPNPSDFGVAEIKGGKVIGLEEKPKRPKSDYALVGVYMFDSTIFEAVHAIQPSSRGELEITDAIQWLIRNGKEVTSHIIKGWWKDTGKLEDLLEANRVALSGVERDVRGSTLGGTRVIGDVVVAEGAVIENSELRGPLVIGEGTVVRDSYIGPFTSISSGCEILGAEIEFSIILENSRIESIGGRMEGSLVGKNVRITRSPAKPRAFRFMVGDSSEIQVPE
jgi:glucose-1-phosphate thymidylyltransferase